MVTVPVAAVAAMVSAAVFAFCSVSDVPPTCVHEYEIVPVPAPVLVTREMLALLRPGAVVVDLAVAQGGNCAGSEPDAEVLLDGVRLIDNIPV